MKFFEVALPFVLMICSVNAVNYAVSASNPNLIVGYTEDTTDNVNQWIWTSLQGTATAVKVISITDNAKYIDFSKNTITLIKDGTTYLSTSTWITATDTNGDTIPDAFTYPIKKATYLIQVEPTASPKTVKIKTMTTETNLAITNHFTSQSIATPAQTAIYTCDPTPTTGDYDKACPAGTCCGTRDCKPDGSDWDTAATDYYTSGETSTCTKASVGTGTWTCGATGWGECITTCQNGVKDGDEVWTDCEGSCLATCPDSISASSSTSSSKSGSGPTCGTGYDGYEGGKPGWAYYCVCRGTGAYDRKCPTGYSCDAESIEERIFDFGKHKVSDSDNKPVGTSCNEEDLKGLLEGIYVDCFLDGGRSCCGIKEYGGAYCYLCSQSPYIYFWDSDNKCHRTAT